MQVPQWLQQNINVENERFQRQYNAAVANFNTQAEQWIKNGLDNQSRGLPIEPFTVPIPRQTVAVPSDDGTETAFRWTESLANADPRLKLPELPAGGPTKVVEATGFSTGAADRDNAMFQMLGKILSDTAAIKAKLGI